MKTMRAVVWTGPGTVEFANRPLPDIGPDELLVQTKAAGVCGTDFHIFQGHFAAAHPPLVMGHEAAGVVVRVGQQVAGFVAGDRIVIDPILTCGHCHFCRQGAFQQCLRREVIGMTSRDGAFADFFTVPASNAFHLPETVSWEDAAAIDPLACTVHALNRVPQRIGEAVAVFGAGPSGLCFVQLCKLQGASKIIAIDLMEQRLSRATKLGAQHALNASVCTPSEEIRKLTGGLGVDLSIEASGSPRAVSESIKATRNLGQVLIYGVYAGLVDGVDFQDQHRREITIFGSSGTFDSYPTAIELVKSCQIDVGQLISHRIQLEDLCQFLDGGFSQKPEAQYQKAVVLMS